MSACRCELVVVGSEPFPIFGKRILRAFLWLVCGGRAARRPVDWPEASGLRAASCHKW